MKCLVIHKTNLPCQVMTTEGKGMQKTAQQSIQIKIVNAIPFVYNRYRS